MLCCFFSLAGQSALKAQDMNTAKAQYEQQKRTIEQNRKNAMAAINANHILSPRQREAQRKSIELQYQQQKKQNEQTYHGLHKTYETQRHATEEAQRRAREEQKHLYRPHPPKPVKPMKPEKHPPLHLKH